MMIAIIFNELTGNLKTVYLHKWPIVIKNEYVQKDIKMNKKSKQNNSLKIRVENKT